ncbi:MAG TPA: enoyl-CoA hydratase-related protein [Syntrophales bacterium]|nr:enoyl-CoA hydratase-related protein [Syntrophales bacterium]HOM07306.1 enoyl-CoA hydratase-related protein [Syntrophales bacterium]HOO00179.1 enoyl-CoA hydratase-related protein [Syntrophales bacterium]HPC01312.1 enoyl-CoA hydratase-related protein [Syntrophales bacterium]HPQ06849.1 enoyl-CoA hydratase-related protein [Syntrophales bacterium]
MALDFVKEGHIAKVGLNRPQEKNALDPDILLDLHRAWLDINADDTIRAVILYSCLPDIFCSGMDLKTAIPVLTRAREPETESERWLVQVGPHVGEAMLKPNIVNKPVIAAINGYCLTGGFEMIMGADLRIASEDALFQMREASLGIMPTGGSNVYLTRMLTPCRGLEILLTADNYPARTLLEWGFLNRVVPRQELMAAATALAERIAANGPLATRGIIRCWRESRDMSYKDAFAKELEIGIPIFGSQDAREGIKAQREKRKPNFPGKY